MSAPQRRHRLVIDIGGDSPLDVQVALDRISEWWCDHAREGETNDAPLYQSGGVSSGWTAAHSFDGDQTHDRYFEQVDAWLAEQDDSAGGE